MKSPRMRQWLLVSWLLCLGLPRLLFEIVQHVQHVIAPTRTGPNWIVGPLAAALLAVGATLLGVNWLVNRWLLAPLAAIDRAARQIAAGDIAIDLPPTRVREINDVAVAFAIMGDALRAAVQQQAVQEHERRMLISAVAHDLRTPLFALRGYLAGIEQGVARTPEKTAHYLAMSRMQADVLEQRITALFEYARIEYLMPSPTHAPVHWNTLVQQTVDRLRPMADAKQITLVIAPPETPCVISGDGPILARMLDNLLENAVRHTPANGSIVIAWNTTVEHLEFRVGDTGAGFAPDDLPHVFTPLYRGSAERHAHGGAGLGLATALRIAQLHGGALCAANQPAGGALLTGWIACTQPARAACEQPS